jgi:hypothetical protein
MWSQVSNLLIDIRENWLSYMWIRVQSNQHWYVANEMNTRYYAQYFAQPPQWQHMQMHNLNIHRILHTDPLINFLTSYCSLCVFVCVCDFVLQLNKERLALIVE